MAEREIHAVTGAFGYSGRYIARRLLDADIAVRTLTNSTGRANPFAGKVDVHPFHFDDQPRLVESLRGATVLYNTYWVRFNHATFKHATAVENTCKLFDAAVLAGVRRVVHISITNPSEDSPLEYFSGKAKLERALVDSGIDHTILRPGVVFGKEDVLINNIAWILRTFPFFGMFGDGSYRLQPIYVDDLAQLAVEQGRASGRRVIDAVGPETFTYRELVTEVGRIIGESKPVVSLSPAIGYAAGVVIGKLVGDVVITREEIQGLMADLLYTDSPPAGQTTLTDWAKENRERLGIRYTSELARRRDRLRGYENL